MMKRKSKIESLTFQKKLKLRHLHALRKRLKEYYYSTKSMSLKLPKEQLQQIDELQEKLGQWHDYRVISQDLQKTINAQKLKPKEIIRLKVIKTKLIADSNQLHKEIKQLVPTLHLM